ncbi:MAG: hypothetical protein DKT66_21555 [Candidatus Melainabacteria bacterium]|jgi:hypothetical protein|nr:MAG: hypothetical protein DKT66_21555 [Candidatus Melainabacteria bacterium]
MVGGNQIGGMSNGYAVFTVSFMHANMLKFELAIIEGKEIKASLCAAFEIECWLRPRSTVAELAIRFGGIKWRKKRVLAR